jgi:phosphatidylserine/phosphatidylglycerophosphate/cardiolipin synthase-like enzyme
MLNLHKYWWQFSFILILISLNGCQNKYQISRPEPLPQDNLIQVYFNHNQSQGADYIEPYRKIKRRGDNLEQIIIEQINSANSTIDLAVQELNLPKIAQALAVRHQAGIKVRVILENTYSRPLSQLNPSNDREINRYQEFVALADTNKDGSLSESEINQNDALVILKNAGISLIDDTADGSKGSGLMHHKFLVIDNQKVITGSANFTVSGIHGDFNDPETRGNANHILVINSQQLANIFAQEFNYMWGDGMGGKLDSKFGLNKPFRLPKTVIIGPSIVTVKFSPTSRKKSWEQTTNGLIEDTLSNGFNSVDLALFVFSDQRIANLLQQRHQQGVKIRALIDHNFAFQPYSEGLDLLGVALADDKCRYEKNNNPWLVPLQTVGISNFPTGDKLHHKFAIIDNLKVITGSHNWSASANYQNDETLLIIENLIITSHFVREFERIYDNSILGIPPYIDKKIQENQRQCRNFNSLKKTVASFLVLPTLL